MLNKIKWILILVVLPSVGHTNELCNPSVWNDNLHTFNQLEANYNQHVKVFNALLAEHKQRPLLSKEFASDELTMLWQVRSRKHMLQTQLNTAKKHHEELNLKAKALSKLSTLSILSASRWEKLAQSCKNSHEMANQISAEWYHINANQLADDCNNLSRQYLGLANLYSKEANALENSQKNISND